MSVVEKSLEVRYLTHMIVFPDGDAMVEQKPFIHDLQFEAANWEHTLFHHQDNAREQLRTLLQKGEVKCESPYPPDGVSAKITHVYIIEDKERPTGWFGAKKEGS